VEGHPFHTLHAELQEKHLWAPNAFSWQCQPGALSSQAVCAAGFLEAHYSLPVLWFMVQRLLACGKSNCFLNSAVYVDFYLFEWCTLRWGSSVLLSRLLFPVLVLGIHLFLLSGNNAFTIRLHFREPHWEVIFLTRRLMACLLPNSQPQSSPTLLPHSWSSKLLQSYLRQLCVS
jgi:hypothetical protein